MTVYRREERVRLLADFVDGSNAPLNVGTVAVDIVDPLGKQIVNDLLTSTGTNIGERVASWLVAHDALVGFYTVRWLPVNATYDPIINNFEVNILTPQEEVEMYTMVRLRIGERIPAGGTEASTMFANAELLLAYNLAGSMDRTVLLLLRAKASEYVRLIDTEESGSVRHLSQMHAGIMKQIAELEKTVEVRETQLLSTFRKAGKSLRIGRLDNELVLVESQYGYRAFNDTNVYPSYGDGSVRP